MDKLRDIKKRSVTGALALTSRTAILQIISVIGTFFLTYFLTPEAFGIFFVVTAIVSFLNYFSDIGLAAALIQKKEDITKDDLATTFTIQQIIVVSICILIFLVSPVIGSFYRLDSEGLLLLKILTLSFFISSLKTIPSIILERQLGFSKLVFPQILETLAFNIVAVYLAYLGWGVSSFTWAVLTRGVVGLIAIYSIAPWLPRIYIHTESAKRLLKFGIPFQLNSFLAVTKDDLFILFLGKVLPSEQMGYIAWAKRWAEAPLRLVMDSVIRVTFPTYARLQEFPDKLARGVEKSLFFIMLFLLPISVGAIVLIHSLILLIPRYAKWEPALLSFYLFVIVSLIAGVSTPLVNALNAIGKIKITLKFMILWTFLTWVLTPVLVFSFGFNGFSFAHVIMSSTVVIVIWITRRYINFKLGPILIPSFVSTGILGVYLVIIKMLVDDSLGSVVFLIVSGAVVYFASLYLLFKNKITYEINTILQAIK